MVALTFDDGPDDKHTPQVLDILQQNEAKATFFLVGNHVEQHPDVVRRTLEEGHEIGNHTYSHCILPLQRDDVIRAELGKTEALLNPLVNGHLRVMRPPMGLFTSRVVDVVESMNYRMVIGDTYPKDPYNPGTREIFERVMARVRKGSIVILHDSGNTGRVDRSQTVAALKMILPALADRGLRVGPVSDLLALERIQEEDPDPASGEEPVTL